MMISGAKGGGGGSSGAKNNGKEIASVSYMKLLFALTEGEVPDEITGKNIYLDGTPLLDDAGNENFPGVVWEFRSGTADQDYIAGFPAVENEISISTELKYGTPWVRSINNTQLSAVRIRLKYPSGLYKMNDSGGKDGYKVEYAIDISTDGSTYTEYGRSAAEGIADAGYEQSYRIDLPPAQTGWQIRIRRLTQNSTGGRHADVTRIESITDIVDAKLSYPHTALLFVQFDARLFDGRTPTVTVKMKGIIVRVPSNYDPINRRYNGTWDGTFKWAWTNNPAWIFYDIATKFRYGLGRRITQSIVDKWSLYRIAQYCDGEVSDGAGGAEARYLCDLYIHQRTDAWSVLMDLAAIFNGMISWSNNMLTVDADMPGALDPDFVFNKSNIVGSFNFSTSSELSNVSAAIVTYSNPAKNYSDDQASSHVPELSARFGFRQAEASAVGCTRETEAQRRGLWIIETNKDDNAVEFKTGMEGRIPRVGKIIGINNAVLAGRPNGGRVSYASGTKILLDRMTLAKPGDRLIVNLPTGKAEGRKIVSVSGRAVTVESAFSTQPETDAGWVIDQDDLAIQLYRVRKVAIGSDDLVTISALPFNPNKFPRIDSGAIIDDRPVTVVPPHGQASPTNIKIGSYYRVEQGIAITTMEVTWDSIPFAVAYEAQWRQNSGNWITVPRTGNTRFVVDGIYSGLYQVRIRAINTLDIASLWSFSAETSLTGKAGKPPVVINFLATSLIFGIELNWNFPAKTADTLKTEVQYSPTGQETDVRLLADVPYPQSKYQQMGLKAGQVFWYRARLVDRLGNSSDYTEWIRGQASTDVSDITDSILEEIKDSDLFNELIVSAVDDSKKVAELADAIAKNADAIADAVQKGSDALADAVQSTKEITDKIIADSKDMADDILANASKIDAVADESKKTADKLIADNKALADEILSQSADITAVSNANKQAAQAIISNALAIADVVVRQTAHHGEFSAKYENLREVIATETESRVTDVVRLEAKSDKAASDITDVRQALATETEARTTAVDQLTAKSGENEAGLTSLKETVTTLDKSSSTKFEELEAKTDAAAGAIQSNAQAIINNSLAQASISTRLSVQSGDNAAKFEQVSQAIATETSARVDDVTRLEAKTGDNAAGLQSVRQAITDETSARASAVEKLTAETGQNAAGLTDLSQVVADEKSASAKRMDALETKTGQNATAISKVSEAVSTETEARTQDVNKLNSKTDKTDATVTSLSQSVATLDSATSSRFDEVEAKTAAASGAVQNNAEAIINNALAQASISTRLSVQSGDNAAKFEQVSQAIATETSARVDDVTRLEAKTGDNAAGLQSVRQAITDETSARASAVEKLTAETGQNAAGLTDLSQVVADEKSASAKRMDALETRTGNNEAAINRVDKAVTTETEARTQAVSQLNSKTEKNASDVSDLAQTVTTLDSAMSSRLEEIKAQTENASGSSKNNAIASITNTLAQVNLRQTLSVQYNANQAQIDRIDTVIADEKSATATALTKIQSNVDKNTSAITSVSQTVSDNASSTAQQLTTIKSDVAGNSASISSLSKTVSDNASSTSQQISAVNAKADKNTSSIGTLSTSFADYKQSTATQINTISAKVDGNTAAISTTAKAVADVNGQLSAMYSVKVGVDKNGVQYAAGMGIGVENTPSGMQSQFNVIADRFAVMSQIGGTISLPFVIQNGQTFIRDAFIQDGSITNAKIGSYIQSSNYVTGKTGWSINKNGSAEFSGVTVRGTIYASSGSFTGDVYAENGYFKGAVYAEKIVGDVVKVVQINANSSLTISPVNFDRTLAIPTVSVTATSYTTGGGENQQENSGSAKAVVTSSISGDFITVSVSSGKNSKTTVKSGITQIPKNTKVVISFKLDTYYGSGPDEIIGFLFKS